MANATTSNSEPGRKSSYEGFGAYLRGVQEELRKAQWPTRPELIRLTQVVLGIIAVVAVYCGGIDALLSVITNRLFGSGQ